MRYTDEQIEKYLKILEDYFPRQEQSPQRRVCYSEEQWGFEGGLRSPIVKTFLLKQVVTFVKSVEYVEVIDLGILIRKSTSDFILERNLFINENIIMRKILLIFVTSCL